MARTEGFYTTAAVTELADGGDFSLQVAGADGVVVSTVPLSVANGQAVIDVAATVSATWPDNARFRLVATTDAGLQTTKWMNNSDGGIDFVRSGTAVPSIDSMTLSGSSLTVNWSHGSNLTGRHYDIHLSASAQPTDDTTLGNELGDSVSIGNTTTHTFSELPSGDYTVYVRLRYSDTGWSEGGGNVVAEGKYVDAQFDVDVDGVDLSGYVSFLDASAPDRARGSISNSDLNTMVNPLDVYWADSAVNTSGLSTLTRSGRRSLAVRVNPTLAIDGSGSDRFAAGMDLRSFGEQEMWLSQYILIPSGHDHADRGKVGVGFFAGDETASGGAPKANGSSVRPIWRVYDGVGRWGLYIYTGGQASNTFGLELYDLNGSSLQGVAGYNQGNFKSIDEDVWVHHLTRKKLNTTLANNDGILQHWIDGVLVKDLDNVGWLKSGSLNFQAATAGNWYGGTNSVIGEFTPNGAQDFYLADWSLKRV